VKGCKAPSGEGEMRSGASKIQSEILRNTSWPAVIQELSVANHPPGRMERHESDGPIRWGDLKTKPIALQQFVTLIGRFRRAWEPAALPALVWSCAHFAGHAVRKLARAQGERNHRYNDEQSFCSLP